MQAKIKASVQTIIRRYEKNKQIKLTTIGISIIHKLLLRIIIRNMLINIIVFINTLKNIFKLIKFLFHY